jgi:hypothetical protein
MKNPIANKKESFLLQTARQLKDKKETKKETHHPKMIKKAADKSQ